MGILNPQGGRPAEPAGPHLTSIDAVAAVCLSERAHVPQVDLQFYVAEDDNHTHFGFFVLFCGCFVSGLGFGTSTSQVLCCLTHVML